jgi:hypothetical protein
MNMWGEAFDMATEAWDDIKRNGGEPTPDQKLALALIYSNLSVSQELSGMVEDKGLRVRVEPEEPDLQRRPGGAGGKVW